MTPIRVLIVDDHPVVRAGLEGMLSSQADLEIVGQAADGASAIDLCQELQPAVVLMDLRMAGMDGVAAISAIKARLPDIQISLLLRRFHSSSPTRR